MSALGDFLCAVGAELGRSPEQMAPLIKKLEDEWYDSVESLESITVEKWKDLGFPQRLVDAIRYRQTPPALISVIPPVREPPLITTAVSPSPAETSSWQVELAPPTLDEPVNIMALLESLRSQCESLTVYVECLCTFAKIVGNILSDPYEAKFRQVNIHSKKYIVGNYSSGTALMEASGFDTNGICRIVYLSRVSDLFQSVGDAIEATGLAKRPQLVGGGFNPFQSSFVSSGDTFGMSDARRLVQAQDVSQTSTESTVPKVLPKLVRTEPNLPVGKPSGSFFSKLKKSKQKPLVEKPNDTCVPEEEADDTRVLLANLKQIVSLSESAQKFQSRVKILQAKSAKITSYPVSTVRVAFVDNCYLELIMGANEQIANVYKEIIACMREPHASDSLWVLTVTPPLRKLDRGSRQTLRLEDFVPSVTMRMMKDGKQCAAKDVLASRYLE